MDTVTEMVKESLTEGFDMICMVDLKAMLDSGVVNTGKKGGSCDCNSISAVYERSSLSYGSICHTRRIFGEGCDLTCCFKIYSGQLQFATKCQVRQNSSSLLQSHSLQLRSLLPAPFILNKTDGGCNCLNYGSKVRLCLKKGV